MLDILKIDHIGIAVSNMEAAGTFWEGLLGLQVEGTEKSLDQSMDIAFLPIGDSEIELLEGLDDDGTIKKFIRNKGEGIHHIAFCVDNIEGALQKLKQKGVHLIDETPRIGAGGAQVAFIHPKSTGGVLVELCQK